MGELRATRDLAACGKFASCLRVGDPRSCELAACGKVAVKVRVDCVMNVLRGEFCAAYHKFMSGRGQSTLNRMRTMDIWAIPICTQRYEN